MIFRSPRPELTIPEVPLTPFLLARAAERPEKPAFIDGPSGRTLTHGQWARAVRAGAYGLSARGFRKGDVLAIYSPNLPEYAVAFHAVSLAGGATTTINPLYTVEELTSQLRDCHPRYLLTVPPFLDKAREAAGSAGVRETFVFGEAPGATPFSALLEQEGPLPEVALDPRQDVVALPYSSGTTGLPKGVMLTHHNLMANLHQMLGAIDVLSEDDVFVGVLPFFHIYGLVVIMNAALMLGATVVTLPRFDLEPFLETLQKYGVTFAHVVPPIALALAKHPSVERYDLSRLRTLFSGAAPLGEAVTWACVERLGCVVMQGYGLTETSPGTHVSPSDPARIKAGAVGPGIPNTECKIVDLIRGVALGRGELGEICVRGPQVMKGYLGRPEATAAMVDAEGWLHTGDIGYAEEDGYLHVVDRVKELIKYKGLQVAPAEIEAILLSHPAVADAAVIPYPDEEAGEVPKAFLVLKGEVTPEEILAYVAERVAPYKRLRRVEVIGQIPKSAAGKILRRVLVQQERERGIQAGPDPANLTPRHRALWAACLFACLSSCTKSMPEPGWEVRELRTPALPGSGEPNLAVAPDGRMLLSWIEPAGEKTHRLRFTSRAGGGEWSEARTVAEGSGWFVNWADFPSLAALPDGRLFAHWLARSGPAAFAYDVRLAASADGGATWSEAVVPHRDGTATEHGFVSLFPATRDRLAVVWLDGRKTSGKGHGHADAGAEMALMHTTIGPDGRLGDEVVLDGRVCDCCQTAAAATARGAVVVYRDRSPKEVRDISVVRWVEGRWSEPRALARDGWEINGCPVNGPAVAAEGRRVAVAWFTAPSDQARVNVAFSADAGETFGEPLRSDDGRPLGRVDVVLLPKGDALVSWMEQTAKGAELRVRRVSPEGTRGSSLVVADSSAARSSGFPRMEVTGGEVVLAWRDPAEPPRVRTAILETGAGAR